VQRPPGDTLRRAAGGTSDMGAALHHPHRGIQDASSAYRVLLFEHGVVYSNVSHGSYRAVVGETADGGVTIVSNRR